MQDLYGLNIIMIKLCKAIKIMQLVKILKKNKSHKEDIF